MARPRKRRARTGLGWIRPLPSGRSQACWYDEARRYRTHTVDTEGQAEDFLLEINSQRRTGSYLDPRAGKATLAAFAAEWLASITPDADQAAEEGAVPISQSTLDLYEMYLRLHILPPLGTGQKVNLGAMTLVDITEPAVQQWVTKLSPASPTRP